MPYVRAVRRIAYLVPILAVAAMAAWYARGGETPAVVVSAASSLAPPLREIARAYEAETGERVLLNLAATGQLAQQIERGAPVDVFVAADPVYIDELAADGLTAAETRRRYAHGRLVLWSAADAPPLRRVEDLADPAVRRVAIANPEHAPYGRAARRVLEAAGVWEAVRPKLVLAESVEQAFHYAEAGNVDAALVARSLVGGVDGHEAPLPDSLHPPLPYELVVVRGAPNDEGARRFAAFLLGPRARESLRRHGLEPTRGDER